MSEAMQRPLPGYIGVVFLHKPTSPLFRFIKLIKPYLIEYLRMRSIELRFLQFDGFEFLNFNWLELASPFRSKKRIEPNPVASNPPTVFDLKRHSSSRKVLVRGLCSLYHTLSSPRRRKQFTFFDACLNLNNRQGRPAMGRGHGSVRRAVPGAQWRNRRAAAGPGNGLFSREP